MAKEKPQTESVKPEAVASAPVDNIAPTNEADAQNSSTPGSSKNTPDSQAQTVTIPTQLLEEMQAQIRRLEAAADAGRLARFDDLSRQGKEEVIKRVRVNTWDDKVVLSWKMVKNVSHVDRTKLGGVLVEDQTIELFLDDGSSVILPYIEWHRQKYDHMVPGEVIEESKRKNPVDGKLVDWFKVQLRDGRTPEVCVNYVN